MKAGIIRRYRDRLPVTDKTPVVTLLEGDTPLLPAPRLARRLGLPELSLYLKLEGSNPTGSFKDRGMTLAVSKALEAGARGVLCASTGNTAASAAAYAARAGLRCVVLLPAGGVAAGKLSQALMHGAEALAVRGNFDQALALARRAAEAGGFTLVNSVNPHRLEGQKTAAFEIAEALGRPPDFQFMPVGNAGNITAYWKGYLEIRDAGDYSTPPTENSSPRRGDEFPTPSPGGRASVPSEGDPSSHDAEPPRMMGVQAAGAAPLVLGRPVARPKTAASAIRIGRPASWEGAIRARDESRGTIEAATDREILAAYRWLAETEGVFCEPSSAAGVAGLAKRAAAGFFRNQDPGRLRIVCVLTGHGLKDPEAAKLLGFKPRTLPAALRSVLKALERRS